MLKRMTGILLIFVIVLPGLFFPSVSAEAKTVTDLKNELEQSIKEKEENEQKQQLTKEEINRIAASITANTNTINQLNEELVKLQEEIVAAEKEIEAKDKEIKEIVNFLQISNGESAYLEYAFGAKDFTDFIYRMAVAEQLSSYNEKLVDEFNALIESNKKKKIEITEKQETLRKKQVELAAQKEKLGNELKETSVVGVSIDDAIKKQREHLQYLEKLNCGVNEDVDDCINRNKVLPPGTAFYRPIVTGKVSSEFGNRCYWLHGQYTCDLHGGIDLTEKGDAVPIYAAAPGIVVSTMSKWKCGGNEVFIIHNINGKKYTTLYAHLRTITVKQGQVVTMDTQVGTMGGDPYREYWDGCSTAQHLHFTIANGHYGTDYNFYSWSTFEANMFDPRIMLNVPARGSSFSGRYVKY